MNNLFNTKRFARLFTKHTVEHFKTYTMSMLVLMGVLVVGIGYVSYLQDAPMEPGMQMATYGIMLLLAGTIFTSTIFADMGDKKSIMPYLTLPASHLEKYLVAWIYSFIVFQLVFTAGFYLVIIFFLSIKPAGVYPSVLFSIFDREIAWVFIFFAFLHSICLCGAVFFRKLHFIKTAFLFFLVVAVVVILNTGFVEALLGRHVIRAIPFMQWVYSDNNTIIMVSHDNGETIIGTLAILSVILWVAAYYKLKEKEA